MTGFYCFFDFFRDLLSVGFVFLLLPTDTLLGLVLFFCSRPICILFCIFRDFLLAWPSSDSRLLLLMLCCFLPFTSLVLLFCISSAALYGELVKIEAWATFLLRLDVGLTGHSLKF